MTIARLRVAISGGGVVGPGLMTFYSRNLTPPLPGSVKAFLTTCAGAFAGGLTFSVPNSGDTLDETTGALVGGWSGSGGGSVTSAGSGAYALGTGFMVKWNTGAVWGGHRIHGRTFMVPAPAAAFDSSGHVLAAEGSAVQSAGAQLITDNGGDLIVWVRPRKAGSGVHKNLPARAGTLIPITSCEVPAIPTSLRSRRT